MTRQLHKSRLIAAFSLTVCIFLLIIFTSNYLNEMRMNKLSGIYNDIRIDSLTAELQYEVLSESPCTALDFDPLTEEMFELGTKLTDMENEMGKNNQQVLDLKEYYSILEIRQWLFVKKSSNECGRNTTPIVFFYSNNEDCPDCEAQGFVLNYIRKSIPNVYVYSFDINLDNSAVKALVLTHNITQTPALLIGNKTYFGYRDAENVSSIIKK